MSSNQVARISNKMTVDEFLSGPITSYQDWFGSGDNKDDFNTACNETSSSPISVIQSDDMLCIEFEDQFVITGYDGNEYHHTFRFMK